MVPVRSGSKALYSPSVNLSATEVAPVALASRSIVVRPPGSDVLALAPGTLERTIFPPERMDVGVTLIGVEELGEV